MTRAKRVDKNQKQVVSELRQLGYSVEYTFMIGNGFPDFIIGLNNGDNILVELKSKGGKLTEDEIRFHERYKGLILTAFSTEEILEQLQKLQT